MHSKETQRKEVVLGSMLGVPKVPLRLGISLGALTGLSIWWYSWLVLILKMFALSAAKPTY